MSREIAVTTLNSDPFTFKVLELRKIAITKSTKNLGYLVVSLIWVSLGCFFQLTSLFFFSLWLGFLVPMIHPRESVFKWLIMLFLFTLLFTFQVYLLGLSIFEHVLFCFLQRWVVD